MADLGDSLEKTHFSKHNVLFAGPDAFFNPVDSPEPHELQVTAIIPEFGNQPAASFFTQYNRVADPAWNLYKIGLLINFTDEPDLRFVDMTIRKMFKKIIEREDG